MSLTFVKFFSMLVLMKIQVFWNVTLCRVNSSDVQMDHSALDSGLLVGCHLMKCRELCIQDSVTLLKT